MELIKKTGLKDIFNEGRNRQCGIFECNKCGDFVERSLINGKKSKSCGKCSHIKGFKKLHWVWACMKQRCKNQNNEKYYRYGARGIKVCNDWQDFLPFKNWSLENGYREGLQIDRIDNDGDYTPDNCRFVTPTENIRNTSRSKLKIGDVENIRKCLEDRTMNGKELAEKYGVTTTLISGIKNGRIWKN